MITPVAPQPDQEKKEIAREVEASLAARRELGPAYDEQFLDALVEKMTVQAQAQSQVARRAERRSRPSTVARLLLAICSLVFGIPLVAIGAGILGGFGLIVVAAMIVAVNIIFAWG